MIGLRKRKVNLIRDYKQFKFEICMIQKEFNDPEITTPSNFPEVIMDEFIDVRNNIIYYHYYIYIVKDYIKCYNL